MNHVDQFDCNLHQYQVAAAQLRKESQSEKEAQLAWDNTRTFNIIDSLISDADAFKDAGAKVSPMAKYRGITRFLALQVGRIIVFLLRFISDRQIRYNSSMVEAIRENTAMLKRLYFTTADKCERHEREIAELKEEIEKLRNYCRPNGN